MAASEVDRIVAAGYVPPDAPATAREDLGAPPAAPPGVPAESTPTFELEMLVSGAALVGLVQLVGASDAWLRAAIAADGPVRFPLVIVTIFAKALLYTLSATFVVHLAMRAYWVGLVGLDSVFPRGPRWDRLKRSGPYRRAELARTIRPLREIAARIDNVASTLFAAGFLLALIALPAVTFVGPAYALGALAERATGGRVGLLPVYLAVIGAICGVLVVPMTVDRFVGARLPAASAGGRRLSRWMRIAHVLGGVRIFGPIYFTLITNVRARGVAVLVQLALFASIAAAFRDFAAVVNGPRATNRFVPEDLAGGVDPLRYDALRVAGADGSRLPSIQSDVIDGPYVRLFVPLGRSERVERAMRARCPGVRATADAPDSATAARELACLTQLYAATLDGERVTTPAHFAASADETSVGIIRYIPTDGLAKGEHVLRVAALPDEKGRPQPPRAIPFWR